MTRLDVVGIFGFGGTMSGLLVFLMGLPHPNWIALVLSAGAGSFLAWWELRASHPFFDVRLMTTNLALARTYLRTALVFLCVYTVLYGLTQWLQAGRGISAQETGLLLLPMSAISALLIWPLSKRNLVRTPLIVAAVACLAGSVGVLALTGSTPLIFFVLITLIFGIGTASGLFRTFGYIGSIASSAIISIAFHTNVSDHHLHSIAVIMIVVSALGLLLVLADRGLMSRPKVQLRDKPPTNPRFSKVNTDDTPANPDSFSEPSRTSHNPPAAT
jgi:hypothetical protein